MLGNYEIDPIKYSGNFCHLKWWEFREGLKSLEYFRWGSVIFKGSCNGRAAYYNGIGWLNFEKDGVLPVTKEEYEQTYGKA